MTIAEVLKLSAEYLKQHNSESSRLDAELLLAHALKVRRLDLYLKFDRALMEPELAAYRALIARRGKGEPVAYLTGHKEFMGLDFEVTPAVLVPNPDTEVLVQRAVELAREWQRPLRVADVGTGSGCIAIAIAHYAGNTEVWASDLSGEAIEVATENASRLGVANRVHFERGDLLEPLPGDFDMICANLPYLTSGKTLLAEVIAQPAQALYAGAGGSAEITRLFTAAPARLRAGGCVLAELDPAIVDVVSPLAAKNFAAHRVHRDLAGHDRVLEACC